MVWETPSSGGKGTWPSAYSEGLTECLLSVVCRQFLFPGPFAGIKLSPLGDPEHIGTNLNVFWGKIKNKKKGMAFTKRVKCRSLLGINSLQQ